MNAGSPRGVASLQCGQPFTQAGGIQGGDRKRSDAAFAATRMARQPAAAFANGFCHSGVYDLYQPAIPVHDSSLARRMLTSLFA